MQKFLIIIGTVLLIVGILYPWLQRLGIGQLPGDIIIKRTNFTFYFPLTTSLIASLILTIIIWLLHK